MSDLTIHSHDTGNQPAAHEPNGIPPSCNAILRFEVSRPRSSP